ncbi:MAG: zinc-binding dehydrogenase [Leptospiraceae bacterium]|nr:zinc-binding dehydrogenase [Leptospiraceae bacterium]
MNRLVHRTHKAGSLDDLKLITEDLPDPKDDEVTIEVKAVGLNFADVFALVGLYSATPKGSFVPGLEFSGNVVKLGKNVTRFNIGDKIMGVTRFGGYATHLNIGSAYIYNLPSTWSYAEGAGFIAQSLTAYYALFPLGNLQEGNTVLIHSAAGGVGIYANRIAKKYKAYTIGSIGNANKIETLQKEGYDDYIVRDKNFYKNLQEKLKGRNLNLVLECIGGKIFEDSFKSLAPAGRIVVYGSANFAPESDSPNIFKLGYQYLTRPKIDPLSMISSNKSLLAFNLIWLWDKIEELSLMLEKILEMQLSPPLIGKTFPFANALDALHYFKSGKSVGKVILLT